MKNTGRDSSVGIATRYRMDGAEIESRWGRNFPHPSRPILVPTQPPVQLAPGLSRGVKGPGRGTDHPPPSKYRCHERVELYLYSPCGPQRPVIGRTSMKNKFNVIRAVLGFYAAQNCNSTPEFQDDLPVLSSAWTT